MSRDPEAVARITENTYKNVMDQFNPGLRNLVNLGKNYEKAVSAMVLAGRAYYDGLTRVGEMTTVSPVSKDLGMVLKEISTVHQKLNESLEENFRKFHREIIVEIERKTEQDIKYMNATLKRFQTEHRHKIDSLEKSQSDLKKLRRKSQGTKGNVTKYDMKETEFMENINSRQSDIQRFISEGCKEALLEEKRRFCFLVDRHCSFANYLNYYHIQSADLLAGKIPKWQESCTDVSNVPDNINNMIQDLKTPGTTPISGTPEPSPLMDKKALMAVDNDTISRNTLRMPPAPPNRAHPSPLVDMFNNPASIQKPTFDRIKPSQGEYEEGTLPRSLSVATGLNIIKKSKVRTVFPHTANNKTLLSFQQGDVITLLIPEEKDGWLYGEHDTTKVKGWFPSSYTRPVEENGRESMEVPSMNPSPAPVRSFSSANLIEKNNMVLPEPDYLVSSSLNRSIDREHASFTPSFAKESAPLSSKESPKPAQKPTPNGVMKHPFLSGENPFATVKLRPTVTNDRSAPVI